MADYRFDKYDDTKWEYLDKTEIEYSEIIQFKQEFYTKAFKTGYAKSLLNIIQTTNSLAIKINHSFVFTKEMITKCKSIASSKVYVKDYSWREMIKYQYEILEMYCKLNPALYNFLYTVWLNTAKPGKNKDETKVSPFALIKALETHVLKLSTLTIEKFLNLTKAYQSNNYFSEDYANKESLRKISCALKHIKENTVKPEKYHIKLINDAETEVTTYLKYPFELSPVKMDSLRTYLYDRFLREKHFEVSVHFKDGQYDVNLTECVSQYDKIINLNNTHINFMSYKKSIKKLSDITFESIYDAIEYYKLIKFSYYDIGSLESEDKKEYEQEVNCKQSYKF